MVEGLLDSFIETKNKWKELLKVVQKMIDLKIEEYCKNCPDFEVEQESNSLFGFDIKETLHTLKCVHAEKCKAIKKYLEGKIKN